MNLENKIDSAVRCLEREYPQGLDDVTRELVIAEVTREHRANQRASLLAQFKSVLATCSKVARLMNAERLGLHPDSPLGGQH